MTTKSTKSATKSTKSTKARAKAAEAAKAMKTARGALADLQIALRGAESELSAKDLRVLKALAAKLDRVADIESDMRTLGRSLRAAACPSR